MIGRVVALAPASRWLTLFSRRAWKPVARLVLTMAVVATLFHFVDWRRIATTLIEADLAWLAPAYGLVIARRAIEAWQQALVLRFVNCPVTWFRVFRANALAVFYALFSPGSLIPMVVKWTDLAAATGKRTIVLNAMVYNRVMLDLLPVIIGAGALAWANPTRQPVLAVVACGLAGVGVVAAICLFAPWAGRPTRRAWGAIGRILPAGLRKRIDRVFDELEPFRGFAWTRHLWLAAIALLAFAVGIALRVMIMKSLGFEVPLSTIIWVDAILVVAAHIPITLGNFGLREGLMIAAFGLYGVPAEVAVAYGLLLYGSRIIFALVGGTYQVALISGLTTMRGRARTAPSDQPPALLE
jgi:glycosyltransferase 2 family protein